MAKHVIIENGVETFVDETEEDISRHEELKAKTHERRNTGRRNALLRESDWTQLDDADLTPEEKKAWKDYRKALRDMDKTGNPEWPTKPGEGG